MNQHRNRILAFTVAIFCSLGIAAGTATGTRAVPAYAQPAEAAPVPPRDAKKVAYSLKSGSIKLDVDNDEKVAPQQFKDFDVVASFVNPGIPRWNYGFIFRRQPTQGALLFTVDETGNASVGVVKDKYQPVKDPVTSKLRKNAGEKNELALYVRGGQIMAFVNKIYIDTWTVSEFLDAGEIALVGFSPADNPTGEIKFTNYLIRTPPNTAPGAPVAPAATPSGEKIPTGNIELVLTGNVSSIPWGRPIGMTKPQEGCNSFNDKSPVQQVQISVRVTNKSSKVMERWTAGIFKPGGTPAFWCYYTYNALDARLEPGQAVNVTFAAFIENGESVESIVVYDEVLGVSNRVSLK